MESHEIVLWKDLVAWDLYSALPKKAKPYFKKVFGSLVAVLDTFGNNPDKTSELINSIRIISRKVKMPKNNLKIFWETLIPKIISTYSDDIGFMMEATEKIIELYSNVKKKGTFLNSVGTAIEKINYDLCELNIQNIIMHSPKNEEFNEKILSPMRKLTEKMIKTVEDRPGAELDSEGLDWSEVKKSEYTPFERMLLNQEITDNLIENEIEFLVLEKMKSEAPDEIVYFQEKINQQKSLVQRIKVIGEQIHSNNIGEEGQLQLNIIQQRFMKEYVFTVSAAYSYIARKKLEAVIDCSIGEINSIISFHETKSLQELLNNDLLENRGIVDYAYLKLHSSDPKCLKGLSLIGYNLKEAEVMVNRNVLVGFLNGKRIFRKKWVGGYYIAENSIIFLADNLEGSFNCQTDDSGNLVICDSKVPMYRAVAHLPDSNLPKNTPVVVQVKRGIVEILTKTFELKYTIALAELKNPANLTIQTAYNLPEDYNYVQFKIPECNLLIYADRTTCEIVDVKLQGRRINRAIHLFRKIYPDLRVEHVLTEICEIMLFADIESCGKSDCYRRVMVDISADNVYLLALVLAHENAHNYCHQYLNKMFEKIIAEKYLGEDRILNFQSIKDMCKNTIHEIIARFAELQFAANGLKKAVLNYELIEEIIEESKQFMEIDLQHLFKRNIFTEEGEKFLYNLAESYREVCTEIESYKDIVPLPQKEIFADLPNIRALGIANGSEMNYEIVIGLMDSISISVLEQFGDRKMLESPHYKSLPGPTAQGIDRFIQDVVGENKDEIEDEATQSDFDQFYVGDEEDEDYERDVDEEYFPDNDEEIGDYCDSDESKEYLPCNEDIKKEIEYYRGEMPWEDSYYDN